MDRTRLTLERIRTFKVTKGAAQSFLWDIEAPRLAIRATANGSKSYIFESKLDRRTIRITIGSVEKWNLAQARLEANQYSMQVDRDIDPREVKQEAKQAKEAAKLAKTEAQEEIERRKRYTLKALCMAYVEHLHAKGKTKSARDCQSAFKVHVFKTAAAHLPANEVTAQQIAVMVRKVFESGKRRTAGVLRNYLVAAFNAARRAPFDATMLSTLIDFQIIVNPAELVPAIAVSRGERNLTAAELKQYMAALTDSPVDQLLWVHLYAGGQRMAQLARSKVSDYNAETSTLRLLDGKGRRTVSREHLIPLASAGQAMLDHLIVNDPAQDAMLFGANARTAGDRVTQIGKTIDCPAFDLKDIRRTCETMLAGMGVSKETRAHLLSHGLGGVQDAHYDRHSYSAEKRNALAAWEAKLLEIQTGKAPANNVTHLAEKKQA